MGLDYDTGEKPILVGYGGGQERALGCTKLQLSVQGVNRLVPVYIVPNEAQEESMIVGQPFTESPGVVVVKDENLTITEKGEAEYRVRLIKTPPAINELGLDIGEVTSEERAQLDSLVNEFR